MVRKNNNCFILLAFIFLNLYPVFLFSSAQETPNEILQLRDSGIEYACSGRFNEARAEFRKILGISNKEQFSINALKTLDDLNKGIISSDYAVLLFTAFHDLEKGSPQEAVLSLQKAIGINSKYAKAYNVLGMIYVNLGQEDKALASFKSAIEVNPAYGEAYYNLAAFYQAKGKPQEAIDCYTKAAATGIDSVEVYINLGAVYAALGKYNEAIAAYEKGLKTDSNNAKLHYGLGLSYLMSDQYFKSKEHLLRAKELYLRSADNDGVQAVEKYLNKFTALEEKWHSKK